MLIHNATVVTFDGENRVLDGAAVRIDGAIIAEVGAEADLLVRFPDDERWDAQGMLLPPGQICAHTHFYGAFSAACISLVRRPRTSRKSWRSCGGGWTRRSTWRGAAFG